MPGAWRRFSELLPAATQKSLTKQTKQTNKKNLSPGASPPAARAIIILSKFCGHVPANEDEKTSISKPCPFLVYHSPAYPQYNIFRSPIVHVPEGIEKIGKLKLSAKKIPA
ncbi:MAG: hypothetical protein ACO1NZ_14255 [Adhaeribacter sp.]